MWRKAVFIQPHGMLQTMLSLLWCVLYKSFLILCNIAFLLHVEGTVPFLGPFLSVPKPTMCPLKINILFNSHLNYLNYLNCLGSTYRVKCFVDSGTYAKLFGTQSTHRIQNLFHPHDIIKSYMWISNELNTQSTFKCCISQLASLIEMMQDVLGELSTLSS